MLAEYNSASFSTGRMNKLRQTDNLERGFTLVELMVTVAIMGVVAAFAVPNMTRQMAEGRMKSTARILESTFKEAKAESLIRRKNVTVTYTAKTATSDGTLTLSVGVGAKKKQLAEYSLDSRSSIDMTPASSVIFKPSKTTNQAMSYVICDESIDNETSVKVTVDKTSNISVTRGGVCTS